MMIDRPTWSQFYYWCGTEVWLIYCSSTNHCFTIVYCFIPYLTRRKWGLRKYWSLQSIQWYLYTNRVLATFFPCCNLSSRAVRISGGRTRWRYMYLEEKTAKHASVGFPIMRMRERHLIFVTLTRQDFLPERTADGYLLFIFSSNAKYAQDKLHVFSAGWLFATFVSCCWGDFVALLALRRLVSSVGRAPVCRAGDRGFKARPDQHSGSLNNWEESAAFVMTSANG